MKRFGNLVLNPDTVLVVSPRYEQTGLSGVIGLLPGAKPTHYDVICEGHVHAVVDANSAELLIAFLLPHSFDNQQP